MANPLVRTLALTLVTLIIEKPIIRKVEANGVGSMVLRVRNTFLDIQLYILKLMMNLTTPFLNQSGNGFMLHEIINGR